MDDMTNLKGYYKQINGTLPTDPGWTDNRTYTTAGNFSLSETVTYKAKLENSLGETLGEDELTINIMPQDASIPANYYNYTVGKIYPVKVSWNSSATTIYGTETYRYDTRIRDAARHMGLIKSGDKDVVLYIKIVPCPAGGYIGTVKNEIGSSSNVEFFNGYIFVTEQGEEIKLPVIREITTNTEED